MSALRDAVSAKIFLYYTYARNAEPEDETRR